MTKTTKPLIGITTQEYPAPVAWGAPIFAQNHQYSDAIIDNGGTPLLIPRIDDVQALRDAYEQLDGILFSGGNDIDPTHYGEDRHPTTLDISAWRDAQELQLVKWAIADDKPLLAICRGMQLFNVALGGTLIQDIAGEVPDAQNHDASSEAQDRHFIAHRLQLSEDSNIVRNAQTRVLPANSHHHQAIKKPAPGVTVTGRAEDGIIESIELASGRFAIGVQCHPESLYRLDDGWQRLFQSFIKTAGGDYSDSSVLKSSMTDEVVDAL